MVDKEHAALTGASLHEPKGVAAAAANKVYLSNGGGSGSWTTIPAATIDSAGVKVFQSQFYNIRAEFGSGTDGAVLSSGSWNTRELNTENVDDLGITTSGNQMSLVAGTYFIEANAVSNFTGVSQRGNSQFIKSKLRVRNITDGTTLQIGMGNRFIHNDDGGGSDQSVDMSLMAWVSGRFTLGGTKTVEIQNWVSTTLSSSAIKAGKALSSGENEIYLEVKLWKLS